MALQYKPTRMELSNLKKRRTVAIRGHKMMKDKRDELVRRFIILANWNFNGKNAVVIDILPYKKVVIEV